MKVSLHLHSRERMESIGIASLEKALPKTNISEKKNRMMPFPSTISFLHTVGMFDCSISMFLVETR
jgi:hypothetical protein